MSVDLTQFLSAQRAIKVASATYDFSRDGGAIGNRYGNSEIVPAGSVIIAWAAYVSTAITFDGTGHLYVDVGRVDIGEPYVTDEYVRAAWLTNSAGVVPVTDEPVTFNITGANVTAGVVRAWVFYLPTAS